MRTKKVEQVVKHSIIYGYAFTQPFLLNINSTPLSDEETFQVPSYKENSAIVRHIRDFQRTVQHTEKINIPYSLPQKQAINGVQSSHEIEAGREEQEMMKQNIKKEKKSAFKQLQTEFDVIQFGETGKSVEKVQHALAEHGYYKGSIDGIYGPLTKKGFEQAEQDEVLPPQADKNPLSTGGSSNTEAKKEDEKETEQPKETRSLNVSTSTNIIEEAKQFIGTPYEWGGTSPSGFDCSGFIQYVYDQEGRTLPRTVREIWNYGVVTDNPSIGDLVFFETYQAGPSHLGIYLGNGDFIHAGTSSGVTISNYKENPYWKNNYIGAKSFN